MEEVSKLCGRIVENHYSGRRWTRVHTYQWCQHQQRAEGELRDHRNRWRNCQHADGPQTTHSCTRYWSLAFPRSPAVIHVNGSSSTTSSAASAANARRLTWSGDFAVHGTRPNVAPMASEFPSSSSLSCTPTQTLCWNWMQNAVRPARAKTQRSSWELSTMKPNNFLTCDVSKRITTWTLHDGCTQLYVGTMT